jgi:hypothetical protein
MEAAMMTVANQTRSRELSSSSIASTMIWTLTNCHHAGQAIAGTSAVVVVTVVQKISMNQSTVTVLLGSSRVSRCSSIPMIVAIAAICTNGKSNANPQVRRCGFMNPSHIQNSSPTNGR